MPAETDDFLPNPNRRQFVQSGVGLTAAGLAAMAAVEKMLATEQPASSASPTVQINPGDTILFQGDSITDAGRKRDLTAPNSDAALGRGYAWLTAAELLLEKPHDNLKIFNRGVSGDKVYQLADRWQADCLDLVPNVLSILVGVNDFWHKLKHGYKGTLEKYETDYRALIKRTKDALPQVKLVICEPFTLKVGSVDNSWFPEFDGYRAAAKKIAEESAATFVPFQTMFDAAAKIAQPGLWAADGVHPTCDGAAIMARWWLNAVRT
jgi:lysophospholipase L1-like esterase